MQLPSRATSTTASKALSTKHRYKIKSAQRHRLHRERERTEQAQLSLHQELLQLQKTSSERDIRVSQIADALFTKGARHECTFTNVGFVPCGNPAMPEVVFTGRSRSGVSSLLRSLFKSRNAVDKANNRHRRDAINCYAVGSSGDPAFHILETPGFGAKVVPWAVVLQHCSLLRTLCVSRPPSSLKMLYWCMDVTDSTGITFRDMDTLKFLTEEIRNFTIVLTKADRNKDMSSIHEQLRFNGIEHPVLSTSAWTLGGVDTLRFDIVSNVLHSLPTPRLSMGEVRKLSERLTVPELPANTAAAAGGGSSSMMINFHRPDSELDREHLEWKKGLLLEQEQEQENEKETLTSQQQQQQKEEKENQENQMEKTASLLLPSSSSSLLSLSSSAMTVSGRTRDAASSSFNAIMKRKNPSETFLQYVSSTSPLRNPFLWPSKHVLLTSNKKFNVIKCPEDPENPYLFQARFAVPRADLSFRRPSLKYRKAFSDPGKGNYLPDPPSYFLPALAGAGSGDSSSSSFLQEGRNNNSSPGKSGERFSGFTIPFFPDIVDVRLPHPQPVSFVGSATYYDQKHGKQLALQQLSRATKSVVDVTSSSSLSCFSSSSSSSSSLALTSGTNNNQDDQQKLVEEGSSSSSVGGEEKEEEEEDLSSLGNLLRQLEQEEKGQEDKQIEGKEKMINFTHVSF